VRRNTKKLSEAKCVRGEEKQVRQQGRGEKKIHVRESRLLKEKCYGVQAEETRKRKLRGLKRVLGEKEKKRGSVGGKKRSDQH